MRLFDRFFGPPSEDKFAKLMMKALRRAGDDRTAIYDKAEFRLLCTKDGEEAGVMNLRNLFMEYCSVRRKDRSDWLARMCSGLLNRMDLPDEFEDVKPDILPTVRPRSMFEFMDLNADITGGKSMNVPSLPLTDHLMVSLVYDLPTTMRFVTHDNLDQWGVTLYEAAEVARRNLAERPFRLFSLSEKLFVMESGDAYDGTRVILTDQIRQLELTGQPVAMPITRDTLLITGSEDLEGLILMLTIAEKKQLEARPLCPIPMRLTEEEWETWRPPCDHPLYEKFKGLECKYTYREYSDQKDLLDKRDEKLGEDGVFVAKYSVVERQGKLMSYCVWSKSVPTWLPKTDCVALFDPETNSHRFVSWPRLHDAVGDMMQPLDNFPPRWFVSDFPTEHQISQLQPEDWSE